VANNDDLGASIGLENEDDLFLWNVTFEGPESTLYEVSIQTVYPFFEEES
jgi:ubiquitin-protein ligase